MNKMRIGLIAVTFVLITGVAAHAEGSTAKEDFERSESLKKLHAVMAGQREHLRSALDAFLVGDAEAIRANAAEIYDAIGKIDVGKKAEEKDVQEEAWVAMMRTASHAQAMKEAAEKKDLKEAYEQFNELTGQCIACHQVVRDPS